MISYLRNPFEQLDKDAKVNSRVVSFDMNSDKAEKIDVSNLSSDIAIAIFVSDSPKNNTPQEKDKHIARPGILSYHEINAASGSLIDFKVNPVHNEAIFEAFVKYGEAPTPNSYDFKLTLPDYSTCQEVTENDEIARDQNCKSDPYKVFKTPITKSGIYFVGIKVKTNESSQHTRKKRSCFGNGRERRSCVEVKELPQATKISAGTLPAYNSYTDANYSVAINQARCLYWSSAAGKWQSDGCKVSYFLLLNTISF